MKITTENGKTIYKFSVPGTAPDVRLEVFDEVEFHVHSLLLKLHSGFFRSFLDSPEKVLPASKKFKYEWVTKIDDDESWHLVAAQSISEPTTGSLATHLDKETEASSFLHLLSAIYNEPYLLNIDGFLRLVGLADYYRCLRIVSRTVTEAFFANQSMSNETFSEIMVSKSADLIESAAKLRHATIFRDCVIIQQNPWTDPKGYTLKDDRIHSVVSNLIRRTKESIGEMSLSIMYTLQEMKTSDRKIYKEMWVFMQSAATKSFNGAGEFCAPKYYRLLRTFEATDGTLPFEELILDDSILTDNDMTLNQQCESGTGEWVDFFFCGYIRDEELPWDKTEEDW